MAILIAQCYFKIYSYLANALVVIGYRKDMLYRLSE